MNNKYTFHIGNYHAIDEATIDINGVTVLAGVNGSGKSTIAHWLYYTVNGMCGFVSYKEHALVEFIQQILYAMMRFVTDRNEISQKLKYVNEWYRNDSSNLEGGKELIENILSDCKSIMHEYIDSCKIDRSRERALRSMTDEELDFSVGYHESVEQLFDSYYKRLDYTIRYIVMSISSQKTSDLRKMITDRYEEKDEMPKDMNLYEEADPLLTELKFSVPLMLDRVIYIDSPMVLSDNVATPSSLWKTFLRLLKSKNKAMDADTQKLYSTICRIINGRVTRKQLLGGSEEFRYERIDGLNIRLADSATGIKTFAYILQLLANGYLDKRTILVIDEPEAHLHPQWVVELSRVLLLLNKVLGVKIVIATHNPDMVSAIQSIAEAHDLQNDVTFYIAQRDDNGLYKYVNLGCEIDKIFESFNIAFERISVFGARKPEN